jgi:HSP20 family molecular chaperone IbpA
VLDVDLKEKDAIHEASKRGKQQLTDTQKTDAAMLDYETKNTKKTLESLEENQEKRVKTVNENAELKYSALNEARAKDYEKMRSSTIQATENARAKFEDKYQSTLAEQNTNLGDLETRASHQLNDIRADTAEKLSAYSTRQKDPFYKMKDVEAKVYDTGDTFMLVATVPEHEQQHISVTIRGNQLALTGYRRNEEKMEIGPGRGKSTSSFQSFSESFPLSGPVDSKLLSKSFDGDKLIVTVPKKPEFTEVAVYDKKTPDKVKVERPQFPENLPPGKYEARNSSKDETVEKSKKAENDSGTKPRSFAPLS